MLYKVFMSISMTVVVSAVLTAGIVLHNQNNGCYPDDDMLESEEVLYALAVDNDSADIVFTSQSVCNHYKKLFTMDNPTKLYRCHEVEVVLFGDVVDF